VKPEAAVPDSPLSSDESVTTVGIGRWAVAVAPARLQTLLGSCVAVILHERSNGAGGIAHIVLPDSQGSGDHPGRYADTAIPALLADLDRIVLGRARIRTTAKLVGGAMMFATNQGAGIGERNVLAVESILASLRIPVVARDLGGASGRRVTLETATGRVTVKVPGGPLYEI
jgi:chemotaxis protein CheD